MAKDYGFEEGQLIIPNNDPSGAFIYSVGVTELYESVEYRVATMREFILFRKGTMTPVDNGIEKYKQSQAEEVGKVYKSHEAADKNFKQGKI